MLAQKKELCQKNIGYKRGIFRCAPLGVRGSLGWRESWLLFDKGDRTHVKAVESFMEKMKMQGRTDLCIGHKIRNMYGADK